mgnify:CR=1 FL=1
MVSGRAGQSGARKDPMKERMKELLPKDHGEAVAQYRSEIVGALTKRDLIRHMATMAPAMLPYLADRPTNLHRFPDGVEAAGFWQRSAPNGAPDWIPRFHHTVRATGGGKDLLVLDSPAALAWAANNGAVEVHPWTSTAAEPEHPTWALIDIDPGERTDSTLMPDIERIA